MKFLLLFCFFGALHAQPLDYYAALAQVLDDALGPCRASQHGFNEGDVEVWSGQGNRDPRQPRTRTHINDVRPNPGHCLGDDRAVEHVAPPQPGNLARTDEAVRNPGVGEQLNKPGRHIEALPKEVHGRRWDRPAGPLGGHLEGAARPARRRRSGEARPRSTPNQDPP